jgi:hypothetical protein
VLLLKLLNTTEWLVVNCPAGELADPFCVPPL